MTNLNIVWSTGERTLSKSNIEGTKLKQKIIDKILSEYLDKDESISDVFDWKWMEEIKQKITSINNIVSIGVLKLLLKSKSNETNI